MNVQFNKELNQDGLGLNTYTYTENKERYTKNTTNDTSVSASNQSSVMDKCFNPSCKVVINMIAMSILPYVIFIPIGGVVPILAKLAVTVLLSATAMLTNPTEEDKQHIKTSKKLHAFSKLMLVFNMLSIVLTTISGRFFSFESFAANGIAGFSVANTLSVLKM